MSIDKVTKRSGRVVHFDRRRIEKAIYAAARAVGNGGGKPWAETIAWAVTGLLEERFGQNGRAPHVEEIQDVVEEVLIKSGHPQVAKAYILYRQKRAEARATKRMLLDTEKLVDDYLQKLDWRVNENSNMNYSLQGLNFYLASSIAARYWLHKIYPQEVQQAHSEGDMHIHDLGMLSGYCAGWDLQDLLIQGFGGVSAKVESRPPKHLRTALGQLVNFFYTLQGEVAGAVAVSNFDTLLAPFIRYDKLDYTGIKQAVQEFVYNINVPTRVGFQSLVWEELVLVRRNGRIEPVEIGQIVDEQFERNRHRVLTQDHDSFAVANADDVQALAFDADGSVRWAPVKAFVRHRVPQGSTFVRMRTSRGTAAVSQAHSMFGFEKLNGRLAIRPVAAHQVNIAHGNTNLTPTNHLVAVRHAPNGGTRSRLDLVELIDDVPQLADRTQVRLADHAAAVEQIKALVQERFGGLTAFYLDYGIKDKGCWRQWAANQSLPYRVWRNLGEDEANAEFSLRNSKLWYARTVEGDRLAEFIRLLGWYITEGHNDISNGLYISQARGGDQDEMMRVLGALGALGRVEEMQGWSVQGNPTQPVLRMAGKGLLASLIGFLGGTYSTNKVIPWFVYELTHDLQEEFIATLLRGDGSEFPKYWDYTTTSKRLSLGLSLLLAMNGYKFSVYETHARRETWSDQYTLRIQKDKAAGEGYAVGDLLGRVCNRRESFAYEREYEYDLSVDTPLENFAGGSGLLCFHNTPFTNITMDLTAPSTLSDQAVVIGGQPQEATYGEFQEEMDLLNRAFAEIMLEGDARGRVFTFPIPTFNVTRDFDWDNPVLEPVWTMTAKYGIPYWSNYINSDMNPEDARSMCPLHPDTLVVVRAGRGMFIRTIKDVYYTNKEKKTQYEVLYDGEWYSAKLVATPTQGCVEITLGNGEKVTMDIRHEQPVKRGRGQAIELLTGGEVRTGMYLPFNATPLGEELDNYEAGFAVGAFLGDGSYDKGALNYSLNNEEKETQVAYKLRSFFTQFGFSVSQNPQRGKVVLLRVGGSGDAAESWMTQFVAGRSAAEKGLTARAFQMGSNFLHGVLDGWYATDGGNRGRIYTISERLCQDFAALCGLLGRGYKIDYQGDARDNRYSEGTVFTLKFHNRTSYGQHFFCEDGFWWYPVESIQPLDYEGLVFCFAVDSEEHLFQTANGLVTHNCRLRLDNRELRKRAGGLFAAAPLTGSAGVVTINLPRIAYQSRDEAGFQQRLEKLMETARTSLEIKRKMLEQLTARGLYPYSRHYLRAVEAQTGGYWSHHFSTIGLIGMNEACQNLIGAGIAHPEGQALAVRTLNFMREILKRFQLETGNLYNLEATPAEGASYRLARADKKDFPDIIAAGTAQTPYYTNSTHLPVGFSDDLFAVLDHQDDLQTLYTGGTVLHIFLGERLYDWRQARKMVRTVAENYHLPYFTLTPTFSICPVHGYIAGEHKYCPYEHTEEQLARYGIEVKK